MPAVRISMPPRLTARHLRVALKYFEQTNRLSMQEWQIALETFDVLGQGSVAIGRRHMRFQQVYDRYVDRQYADGFIAQLLALQELAADGEILQQQYAFEILAMLQREGLYHETVVSSEYLAAYCLYWWMAFTRGYRFELLIFRDLRASGIAFLAHDLRRRAQRRSPYDLIVLRQVGDIKTTTYFLSSVRSLSLHCDFYITRLYHPQRRRYVAVVVLTEAAWHALNGEVELASLETAAGFFPQPVQIVFAGQRFVIVPFDLWKEKVKQRQREEIYIVSKARFDGAFAEFIRRGEEKITPKTFFQVLREIEQERMQRTIELRAKVVEGTLQFEPSPDLTIHNNEIIVGNQRIVIKIA